VGKSHRVAHKHYGQSSIRFGRSILELCFRTKTKFYRNIKVSRLCLSRYTGVHAGSEIARRGTNDLDHMCGLRGDVKRQSTMHRLKAGLLIVCTIGLSFDASAHQQTTVDKDWSFPPTLSHLYDGSTRFNVKAFGAVCDGVTDDTEAIQKTYNEAGKAMGGQGGAGIVYFPPSTGYCKATILVTPNMWYPQGWLVSLFDNGLFVQTIHPGNNNAFIGRTSNFAGWGNVFLWGPNAEWQQWGE
jgi:Pectate lyase superfamily protein